MNQDTLFTKFRDAAKLRFEVGETNQLEKVTAETRLMEIKNLLQKNEADLLSAKKQLQVLLNSDTIFEVSPFASPKRELQLEQLVKDSLNNNPMLQYIQQQTVVTKQQAKLHKSEMLPDLFVGYQNQSLQGYYDINGTSDYVGRDTRFQSISVGIAIPLWYKEHTARIKSANLDMKASEAVYEQSWKNFQGKLTIWIQAYLKQEKTLGYYENNLLPQADIMLENAQMGFAEGEIDYVQFVQSVNQAIKIKNDYLNEISLYNEAVINLEMISGRQ